MLASVDLGLRRKEGLSLAGEWSSPGWCCNLVTGGLFVYVLARFSELCNIILFVFFFLLGLLDYEIVIFEKYLNLLSLIFLENPRKMFPI